LALATLVIVLPLSFVLRHKPEQYDMLPDGQRTEPPTANDTPSSVNPAQAEIGGRGALRSRTFWHLALAGICLVTVVMSVMTHIVPYLTSVGLDRSLAGVIASAIPVVSILGRLSFGWLADRHGSKTFAVIAFGMMSAGGILLAFNTNLYSWVLVVFVLLFGIGFGASVVLRVSLLRESFASARFGTILGIAEAIAMVGGLIGPPLAGWVFDEFGSYQYMWYAVAGLTLAALVLMKTMPLETRTT